MPSPIPISWSLRREVVFAPLSDDTQGDTQGERLSNVEQIVSTAENCVNLLPFFWAGKCVAITDKVSISSEVRPLWSIRSRSSRTRW